LTKTNFSLIFCRRCTENGFPSAVALPRGDFAQRHHRHRLRHAVQVALPAGGLQTGESGPADHLAESELHGPAAGVGAEFAQEWSPGARNTAPEQS